MSDTIEQLRQQVHALDSLVTLANGQTRRVLQKLRRAEELLALSEEMVAIHLQARLKAEQRAEELEQQLASVRSEVPKNQ